ncbi:MAG: translation initiation factor IF-2B subunit delta [Candidatus Aenigmarchaeota archaeon ex4484_224]|nr:MAG: translation initiation factor IF-2B subunit delta [Candidatus Aenigmarchaeota archaeon ex4484_224]
MNLKFALKQIKDVKVQGAKEIAIFGLKFLKEYSKKYGFGKKFETACEKLEKVRPTAVVLHNVLEIVKKEKRVETFDELIKELENSTKKLAEIGQKIIPKKAKIMTHCHSGEALAVIKKAKEKRKKIEVFATVTEPLFQGIKTVKELKEVGIKVNLIADSAAGYFMKDVDMVIVGSDAIRKEGIVNKIGTYLISLAAKKEGKKFYMVGNHFKFDKRKKFVIEERSENEIWKLVGKKIKGVKVRNPAFDIVPWENITALITDFGILKKKDVMKYLVKK